MKGNGILVNNIVNSKPALTIKENRIRNSRNAIQIMNQDKGFVTANIIYFLVPDADILSHTIFRNGIITQSCNTVEISFNEIYRSCIGCVLDPGMNGYLRGISVDLSWARVHENYVKNIPTASRVFYNCNGTDFFCNNYDNCIQGYVWDLGAQILAQGAANNPTNNAWTNWNGPYKIERIIGVPLQLVPWFYEPAGGVTYDPIPFMGATDVIIRLPGS